MEPEVQSLIFSELSKELKMDSADSCMIFNTESTGYYLVTYDKAFYDQIGQFAEQLSDRDMFSIVLSYYLVVIICKQMDLYSGHWKINLDQKFINIFFLALSDSKIITSLKNSSQDKSLRNILFSEMQEWSM